LLPVVIAWFSPGEGELIALIKPQFEAGRRETARGDGVIRDPAVHSQVLQDVLSFAQEQGFTLRGLIRSPLLGPKGNTEFLAWMVVGGEEGKSVEELLLGIF
jgi:23S rRNA (cytidine1920-2'-O)/16S rRNA (cytidine1409-2'-O)-methyltransferase